MNLFQRAIRHFERNGRFDWMPDKMYLKIIYLGALWKWPNLKDPQTYTEKLQWLKLYDHRPEYSRMVDKCDAKRYVAEKIGEEYIIPTLGVWDSFDEIDFDSLPNQFVLKCTHDSGGVVICDDKETFDREKAKKKIDKHLKSNYYLRGREWPYKNIKPRIIAEQFIKDSNFEDLRDYKFFCFDGKVKALFIATDRHVVGEETKFDYFDEEFNHLPFSDGDPNADVPPEKPICFEEMKRLAEELSVGIPHVRVDFYEVDEKIYFGEMTFFCASGLMSFNPKEWDYTFGSWITLPPVSW